MAVLRASLAVLVAAGLLTSDFSAAAQEEALQRSKLFCLRPQLSGSYSQFAYLLAQHLRTELGETYEVSVTYQPGAREALSGAMDIISAIADLGETEDAFYVGLTQSDVAFYFLEGGHPLYPNSHVHRENVAALGWAYSEYLHIYSANPELCASGGGISEHARQWHHLYLGELGSGTLITSTNVLSLIQETSALVARAEPGRVSRRSFRNERIPALDGGGEQVWAGTMVSGTPEHDIQNRLTRGEGCLVGLSPPQKRHLATIYSRFYRIGRLSYLDRSKAELAIDAIEVPALLVASKRLPAEPAEAIAGFFRRLDGELGSGQEDATVGSEFLGELADRIDNPEQVNSERLPELYKAIRRSRQERRTDLVLRAHRSMTGMRRPGLGWEFWVAALSFGGTIWLGVEVARRWRQHGFFEVPLRFMLPTVFLAVVFWTHACLWVVQLLDYNFFMTYRTDALSPFLVYSYLDLLPKLIHHMATAFTAEELFPIRRSAQLVWLTLPLVIIGNMLWGATRLVVPQATSWLKKHLKGGTSMQLNNHIVICNWHLHAEDVIRQLYIQAQIAGREDREIAMVTSDDCQVTLPRMMTVSDDSELGEHFVHGIALNKCEGDASFAGLKPVYVFRGDVTKPATLERLRVEQAEVVIVFPNSAVDDPDGPTAITVLNIQRRIRIKCEEPGEKGSKEEHGGGKRPRVVVWCADPGNVPVFLDEGFGLDDVCSAEWAWRVICQATAVPHVSNIYRRLMTSTAETNEFYEFRLPDEWRRCPFYEIQDSLRTYNMEDANVLEGRKEQKNTVMLVAYCEAGDTRRENIHINPNPRSWVSVGDSLFVLTYTCEKQRKREIMDHLVKDNRKRVRAQLTT